MNSPASVRARLLNLSKRAGEDFQAILTRYAIERFLFRLGQSSQRSKFVLKGAMLFVAWEGQLHRPTKDLDLLGFGSPNLDDVVQHVRDIVLIDVDDGLAFDSNSIAASAIAEETEYGGVRVKLVALLDQARIGVQIDVGFGDAVSPEPLRGEFPTLLNNLEPPVLWMYPPEVVIAEKLHAMVVLDIRNSRMKDFYDVWHLAFKQEFELRRLHQAIRSTFERRNTSLPTEIPFALTDGFLLDANKDQQWRAFLDRLNIKAPSLQETGRLLAEFTGPLFLVGSTDLTWQPPNAGTNRGWQ